MRIMLFGLWMLIAIGVQAQQLYFCEGVTETGQPENISNRWQVAEKGGALYFLFVSGQKLEGEITWLVEEKKEDSYREFDLRVVKANGSQWTALDYRIPGAGEYRVTVLDSSGKQMARESFSATEMDEKISPAWYTGAKVIFCKSLDDDKPVGEFTDLELPESGDAFFKIQISLDHPLKTYRLVVDVWTVKNGKLEEYLESLYADCDVEDKAADVDCVLYSEGEYRFMIYNGDQVYVGSAELTVKNE